MAPAATTTPTAKTPPAATTSAALKDLCIQGALTPQKIAKYKKAVRGTAPVLASYRKATTTILDPTGKHLESKTSTWGNVSCGGHSDLRGLRADFGWRSGDALGVVQVEAAHSHQPEHEMEVVMDHEGWTTADLQLPAGVTKVEVADYEGGHAVFAKRDDGLTVAVDAEGVWGNNMPPGSPPARDLPGIDELVKLAASPLLTLPKV
jgi:hypothetical protein